MRMNSQFDHLKTKRVILAGENIYQDGPPNV